VFLRGIPLRYLVAQVLRAPALSAPKQEQRPQAGVLFYVVILSEAKDLSEK
jgi:hypothetical protein